MSELQRHPQHSSTFVSGLDPNLEALVSRIVAIRLQDAENQYAEQNEASTGRDAGT